MSLTVCCEPLPDVIVLFRGLNGREGDGAAERVAEFHGAEPVQLEGTVEVAATPNLLESHGAAGEGHGAGSVHAVRPSREARAVRA